MSTEEFKKIDNSFNEGMFLTKVNNVFIKLFTAIMTGKLIEIKHFVSDDVYNYALKILNNAKEKDCRQMYDELNVKDSNIRDIEVAEDKYIIKVYLQSRYMDYIINLSNGNLVSGDDSSRIQVNYNLTFSKKMGAKNQGLSRQCPHCGAPIDVNSSGKCAYCDLTYNLEDYDWILDKLEIC